jgi:hypothetical protein
MPCVLEREMLLAPPGAQPCDLCLASIHHCTLRL